MKIRDAEPSDNALIAEAILGAIGPEITAGLAGENHSEDEVREIFKRLAARTDTQYSFKNARIACDEEGNEMGVCVSYDGALLLELRRPFFQEAREVLGWDIPEKEIDNLPGETSNDEFYLDTLMTRPDFRGRGVAKSLIADAKEKANKAGKPLGLLCDLDNDKAFRLYKNTGFKEIGLRPFAGHEMRHMRK